jgi:S-adenosylmethionine decarboxylase
MNSEAITLPPPKGDVPSDSAGTHLIMDGYVEDASVFTPKNVSDMFHELVNALAMKMLREPEFTEVPIDPQLLERSRLTGEFFDEGGMTGTALISTSHMAFHCWPLRRFFSLDVFSCKVFDAAQAAYIIEQMLKIKSVNKVILQRRKPSES